MEEATMAATKGLTGTEAVTTSDPAMIMMTVTSVGTTTVEITIVAIATLTAEIGTHIIIVTRIIATRIIRGVIATESLPRAARPCFFLLDVDNNKYFELHLPYIFTTKDAPLFNF